MTPRKILVVDDEELIREMLTKAFTTAGYQVRTAASGEDALAVLRQERYPVLFLDLNLPGMNGLELCRKVKEDNPAAIAYALTGYASLFEVVTCREAGFDDYFTKPAELRALLQATEQAFEKLDRWRKQLA